MATHSLGLGALGAAFGGLFAWLNRGRLQAGGTTLTPPVWLPVLPFAVPSFVLAALDEIPGRGLTLLLSAIAASMTSIALGLWTHGLPAWLKEYPAWRYDLVDSKYARSRRVAEAQTYRRVHKAVRARGFRNLDTQTRDEVFRAALADVKQPHASTLKGAAKRDVSPTNTTSAPTVP